LIFFARQGVGVCTQKSGWKNLRGEFTEEIVELREDCIVVTLQPDRREIFVYVNDLDNSFENSGRG
jgi:hypothetical protein